MTISLMAILWFLFQVGGICLVAHLVVTFIVNPAPFIPVALKAWVSYFVWAVAILIVIFLILGVAGLGGTVVIK